MDRTAQSNSIGYSTARDTPPAAPAPVHCAQAQLNNEIDTLHSLISSLGERLQSVLGPSSPSKEPIGKVTPVDSTVAQKIEASARAVRGAIDRLLDIRDRLEV